jgi:uncharacterized membrane protein YgcG
VTSAELATGLRFTVHIGPLDGGRAAAQAVLGRLSDSDTTVLVAVDPAARGLEIVTGGQASHHVDDRACTLAALAMTSSFSAGDLVGGLVNGLQVLSDHGRRQRVLNLDRV